MQKGASIVFGVVGLAIILLAFLFGSWDWGEEGKSLEYEVTYYHGERGGIISFELDITLQNIDHEGGAFSIFAWIEDSDGETIEPLAGCPVPYPGAMPSEDDIQYGYVEAYIEPGDDQTFYFSFLVPPQPVEIVHVYYDVDSSQEGTDNAFGVIGKICGVLLGIGLLVFSVVLYFSPELPEGYLEEYERRKWEKRERAKIGNLTCLYCGKVCKSGGGRSAHERACSENPDNKVDDDTD